jgi:DNA invertase Pin-like site-specific DNA recombinase
MANDTKPLRVARYIRVSKFEQRPALQSDETMQLIHARGWTLVDTYLDQGVSGTKGRDKRPELDRMMAEARKGRYDVCLVWRADRAARSLSMLLSIIEELSALGIDFVSCTEPFDSTTPHGKLILSLCGAFSAFERDILVERTRAGLDACRRRGIRVGRPRVFVDVARAILLRREGLSLRKIARKLGVGCATLCRALKNAEAEPLAAGEEAAA